MRPLAGIRVIEIANWAAVPSTGALLAEQGAEVIKIEPPTGDPMRGLMHQAVRSPEDGGEPIDHAFQFANRQKNSVAIALDTDAGRQLALDLVASADVVITNLLPNRRSRLGLTVDDLHGVNPTAIIGLLTGFGETGPDADTPGFDLTAFFARSGLSSSIGGFDGRPPRWRAAQGDHVAGLSLYSAVVTALFERSRTGEGRVVETSLLASAAWSNAFDLGRAAADGRPSRAKDRRGSANPMVEAFRCADGRFVQLALSEPVAGWRILCDVFDRADLLADDRFATPRDRFINMVELVALLDEEMLAFSSGDIVEAITARGGAAAVVLQSHEVVNDPQVVATGVLRLVEDQAVAQSVRHFAVVASPFSLGDGHVDARGIGPAGADTDEVLRRVLDLDDEALRALETDGVIVRSGQIV